MRVKRTLAGVVWRMAVVVTGCQPQAQPGAAPPAHAGETKGAVPDAGPAHARVPLSGFDLYLNAFHVMKDEPSRFFEAHHYCKRVDADRTECVLFDGTGDRARMNGVEYIVSEKVFDRLPPEERKYWHPHDYEILSGQLVLPTLTASAEKATVALMMNTYGKTWHFHDTPVGGDAAPMGPPGLAWSFNADGELPQAMLDARDRRFHIRTEDRRKDRADLVFGAHPQEGVDALAKAFPGRRPIAGVADKGPETPPDSAP